jgi:hypothetical protein
VQRRNDIIAIVGLILGATLGIGGTLVSTDSLRQIFWMMDGVGVVVATSLLAVRFVRGGDDIGAAGFIVFALGESLLVSGNAAGLEASVPSFGGGVALWSGPHQPFEQPGHVDTCRPRRCSGAVRDRRLPDRLRRTPRTYLVTAAVLRVPVYRAGIRRVDLDDHQEEVRQKGYTTAARSA